VREAVIVVAVGFTGSEEVVEGRRAGRGGKRKREVRRKQMVGRKSMIVVVVVDEELGWEPELTVIQVISH